MVIDRRGPSGSKAFDPIWLAGFRINGRKVARSLGPRFVGDAAHIHSPAGGQGMNTGMQDAFNLAWKLALVVHGTCGEQLLDSYSPERSHVGDKVLKSAGRLTAVGTMKNPVAQAVRNLVGHLVFGLAPVQHAFADNMTEVTIGYPESPLNGPAQGGSGPKPGDRVVPGAGLVPVGSGSIPTLRSVCRQELSDRRSPQPIRPAARSRHPAAPAGGRHLARSARRLRRLLGERPGTLSRSISKACASGQRHSRGLKVAVGATPARIATPGKPGAQRRKPSFRNCNGPLPNGRPSAAGKAGRVFQARLRFGTS